MGYIGCGTKKNKILWGVFAGLVLVAAILLGVGMGQFPVCRKKLPGTCNPNNSNMSRTRASQLPPDCRQIFVRCWRPFLIMSAIGVVALILALATTCIMCCCSKPVSVMMQLSPQSGWWCVGADKLLCCCCKQPSLHFKRQHHYHTHAFSGNNTTTTMA